MAKHTSGDVKELTDAYLKGQEYLSTVEVDIPQENNVDPLILIRTMNGPKTIDLMLPLVIEITKGNNVLFKRDGKVIFTASIRSDTTPERLGNIFTGQPQLMELLVNICYGIMLKKLTPPLNASNNAGSVLEPEAAKPEETPGF